MPNNKELCFHLHGEEKKGEKKPQENSLEKINVLLSKELNNAKRTSEVFGEIN